jgi:Kef-type K+ transport system membrane component KefB
LLTEHQILVFWTQLLVLLVAARGLGLLMARLGQPQVVGELAAGLLLGPSLLGRLAPGVQAWLFPADPVQQGLLAAVGWLGVFLLLVATGFETDVALIRRLGRATSRVVLGSLLIPLLFGVVLGLGMPDAFLGEGAAREAFALFMGMALGISALPVIAKILAELDLMRRNVAQVILAAAMVDDVAGWVLLGVVAGLAQSGALELRPIAFTLGGLALFLAFAFSVGQRLVDGLLRSARQRRTGLPVRVSIMICVGLLAGVATHSLGLEAVFGAFIAGVVLGRSRFQEHEGFASLQTIAFSVFAPIFFASAGLRVDLGLLAEPDVVAWGVGLLLAASASKFLGTFLGSRLGGLPAREGVALGVGLNARGSIGIVVATVGLSVGVLNDRSYAVIVLMAMVTSMMAPPLLRAVLRGWAGSAEERDRLARERLLGGGVLVRAARLLLPSHGGPNSILAARIVDLAWPHEVEVTILSAGADVPTDDLERVRSVFTDRPVVHEHRPAVAPLDAILDHVALGYGAIAVGATDVRAAGRLVSPVIDDLLAKSPLPVVMVRSGARESLAGLPVYRRILVPAIGTEPGRAAQEIAFNVARRTGAQALVVHVVTTPPKEEGEAVPLWGERVPLEVDALRAEVAQHVVEEARAFAAQLGVRAETVIRTGVSASREILALARERGVDLLVVASNLRQFSGRPFLGHGVEELLEEAEATVVVVTAPPGWVR